MYPPFIPYCPRAAGGREKKERANRKKKRRRIVPGRYIFCFPSHNLPKKFPGVPSSAGGVKKEKPGEKRRGEGGRGLIRFSSTALELSQERRKRKRENSERGERKEGRIQLQTPTKEKKKEGKGETVKKKQQQYSFSSPRSGHSSGGKRGRRS